MSVKTGKQYTDTFGYWQLVAYNRKGARRDLSVFRGLPVTINSFTGQDPFGAKDLQLTFPQITPFETFGFGDLDWLEKGCQIQLIWRGKLPFTYRYGAPKFTSIGHGQSTMSAWTPGFVWEGQVVTPTMDSEAGVSLLCTGAAYQLDYYQARPEYPYRPFTYEHAIARQFRGKPHLKLKALQISWPEDWPTQYTHPHKPTPSYLIPQHLRNNQNWTGLLTRETGKWEAVLTSYILTLLNSMYTTNGRWTVDVWRGRRPVLEHRSILLVPNESTIVVDPLDPGVKFNLVVDWSQTLDVVYAQGTALDGVAFSGMEVSSDGGTTYYVPAAARRQAFPISNNKWLDRSLMPIEIMLQVQQGLDPAAAQIVARDHLRRFSDAGVTGTVTLSSDPTIGGVLIPRYLVRPGMQLQVPGLFGRPEGFVLHVTENTCDLDAGTNQLTVDSKYRDAITVQEARMAGRDTLQVSRSLIAGQYQPPVPDQLVPWSYQRGSGFIPSGKGKSSLALFDGMPDKMQFPWTDWTTQRPPGHHKWRNSYIGPITPDGTRASNMWAYRATDKHQLLSRFGIPIFTAQACTIRLLQIAAYNADGTVAKVPFHVSFYVNSGVAVSNMPMLTTAEVAGGAESLVGGSHATYAAKDYYPFGSLAWEQYNSDGTLTNPQVPQAHVSSHQVRIYGTYFQMAGFYPGSDPGPTDAAGVRHPNRTARLAAATGLLVDESQWSIDTTTVDAEFDPVSKKNDQKLRRKGAAGMVYAMIYCDQVDPAGNGDVYFLGRMFRVPTGGGTA